MRVFVALVCLVLVIAAAPLTAQDATCMQQMAESFQNILDFCQGLGDNQACLGSAAQVIPQPGAADTGLREAGDRATLANINALIVGGEGYGAALMKIHPDLGGTFHNQTLMLALYGATQVQNARPVVPPIPTPQPTMTPVIAAFTTLVKVNMRYEPNTSSMRVGSLRAGDRGLVLGRSTDGKWFYVAPGFSSTGWVWGDSTGWVWGEALRIDGDINALPVDDHGGNLAAYQPNNDPTPTPQAWQVLLPDAMRNLKVQTGISSSPCTDTPSGLLIQTNNITEPQKLLLNGVSLSIDGTLDVQAPPGGDMTIRVLAGTVEAAAPDGSRHTGNAGNVTIPGGHVVVEAGMQFHVLMQADGAPAFPVYLGNTLMSNILEPEPIEAAVLDTIPLGLLPDYVPLLELIDPSVLDDRNLLPMDGLYQISGMYTVKGCADTYGYGETREIVSEQVHVSLIDDDANRMILMDAMDQRGDFGRDRAQTFLSLVNLQAHTFDANGSKTTHPALGVYVTTYTSRNVVVITQTLLGIYMPTYYTTDETRLISPTRIEGYRIRSFDTCTQQWDYALEYVDSCQRLETVEPDLYQCVNAP
jgi:hypothetical protein